MRSVSLLVAISALAQSAASATVNERFLRHLSIATGYRGDYPSSSNGGGVAELKRDVAVGTYTRADANKDADADAADEADIKGYRFLNKKTRKFAVNGKRIPDVKFDVGESYSGLLPISTDPKEERQLFFWFFPSQDPNHGKKDITLWLNGGPGCSSLGGLLTENGPFLWQDGTVAPYPNPYAWNKLTNMIWVEQPVGTGFSRGTPNITNEHELAQQFAGFWKNFMTTFDMQGADVYVTGESYAGMYVPYIAKNFLDQQDSQLYKVKGVSINNPVIGDDSLQYNVPIMPFFNKWQGLINLDEAVLAAGNAQAAQLGYFDYIDTYFRFPPPKAPFPTPNASKDYFDDVFVAAGVSNPCWNGYNIAQQCPAPASAEGDVFGRFTGLPVYFARRDVQRAIHAIDQDHSTATLNWTSCVSKVFAGNGGDYSVQPLIDGNRTLVSVIEATNNTIIGSSALDTVLMTNGTLFTLQNATWHGKQGFDAYLPSAFVVPKHNVSSAIRISSHMGNVGRWAKRDGLTVYEVQLAGHQLPGWSLSGGYRMLQVLLGKVTDLGSNEPVF